MAAPEREKAMQSTASSLASLCPVKKIHHSLHCQQLFALMHLVLQTLIWSVMLDAKSREPDNAKPQLAVHSKRALLLYIASSDHDTGIVLPIDIINVPE